MATQAPTFGLDGSELDVMDGLFFNELTDLPVEPAHNQTLFAQPKSEPPITDEELIASLPLPHEAPAPPPAPPPPPSKPAARGAAKDAADLSETRRARNREHARRSRCRKKLIIESLQQSLTAYQAENERLRQFVRAKLGEAEAAPRLEWCEARSKGEATDTDLTGGANARMINKYDYGLLEALKHARRSFVITDPTLPDNPIVFASGVCAASFFSFLGPARVDGVTAWPSLRSARDAPRRGAPERRRRCGPEGSPRHRDAVDAASAHTRTPSPRPGEHASVLGSRRWRMGGTRRHRSPREHTPSPRKHAGGFLSLTGYKLEQVLGRNCRFLQGPRTDARAVAKIRDAIKSGRDVQIVLLNYKIDSTTFWNHFFIAALRDDKGDVVNFLGVQIEVSERVAVGILQNAEGKAKQPEKGPAVQAAAAAAAAQLPPKSSGTKRERGA